MTTPPHLPANQATPLAVGDPRRWVAELGLAVLKGAWAVRHPFEPFVERGGLPALEPLYYQASDGWEAPLWRLEPKPGAAAEPVVLAHALGCAPGSLHWTEQASLARALQAAGYAVYLLEHRGDRNALCGPGAGPCDFDGLVEHDVPAALAAVTRDSGFPRALWLGHGLGGQALLAHLARGGAADLAGAAVLGAAASFSSASSRARVLGLAARMLPANLRVPIRRMAQLSAARGASVEDLGLGRDLEGPRARGLLLRGAEDVGVGFVAQAARWMESGTLCDREDRVDYVAALAGVCLPVLGISARGDRVCAPEQLDAALAQLAPEGVSRLVLDETWSHLDLLVGRRAAETVAPAIVEFFAAHRDAVSRPRGPSRDGWGDPWGAAGQAG